MEFANITIHLHDRINLEYPSVEFYSFLPEILSTKALINCMKDIGRLKDTFYYPDYNLMVEYISTGINNQELHLHKLDESKPIILP